MAIRSDIKKACIQELVTICKLGKTTGYKAPREFIAIKRKYNETKTTPTKK